MKKWLITGSVAAHHWFPEVWTKPEDIDILTPSIVKGTSECRVETQWHEACDYIFNHNSDPTFVDANFLFTIKLSHAEWNVKWEKTMRDIWKFQQAGCVFDTELLRLLKPVWRRIHGKKQVNLAQTVDQFFSNDAVTRVYDHEAVHEAVKFYSRPLHESIRPSLDSVWCSHEMFSKLSLRDQHLTATEEIMVTAIERCKLTSISSKIDVLRATTYAHKQLVTSMTTGWFNQFLILNAPTLLGKANRTLIETQIRKAIFTLENSHV